MFDTEVLMEFDEAEDVWSESDGGSVDPTTHELDIVGTGETDVITTTTMVSGNEVFQLDVNHRTDTHAFSTIHELPTADIWSGSAVVGFEIDHTYGSTLRLHEIGIENAVRPPPPELPPEPLPGETDWTLITAYIVCVLSVIFLLTLPFWENDKTSTL